MKKYLFLVVFCLFVLACKKKDKVESAMAAIPVELKVERFDKIFFETPPEDLDKVKKQFPFFIDKNTGIEMYESQDIIHYLFKHYGRTGKTPTKFSTYPKIPVVAFAGTLINGARGVWINQNSIQREAPAQLLELWGFEASPFTRVVRGVLTELELPFIFHNVPKERWQDMGPAVLRLKPGKYEPLKGGKREKVIEIMGRDIQVPYLVDPNTGVKMFESAKIVKYLKQQYA